MHILPSEPFEVYKFCNTLVLHWLYPIKKEINYRYIHSVQKEKSAEIITALCSLQTVHSQQPPQFGGVLKTDCIQRASWTIITTSFLCTGHAPKQKEEKLNSLFITWAHRNSNRNRVYLALPPSADYRRVFFSVAWSRHDFHIITSAPSAGLDRRATRLIWDGLDEPGDRREINGFTRRATATATEDN